MANRTFEFDLFFPLSVENELITNTFQKTDLNSQSVCAVPIAKVVFRCHLTL